MTAGISSTSVQQGHSEDAVAYCAELADAGWSSCRMGSFVTSTGLHRPKSDSFMWPLPHSKRLSGLISLQEGNISHLQLCMWPFPYSKRLPALICLQEGQIPHLQLCMMKYNLDARPLAVETCEGTGEGPSS